MNAISNDYGNQFCIGCEQNSATSQMPFNAPLAAIFAEVSCVGYSGLTTILEPLLASHAYSEKQSSGFVEA